MLDSDHELLLAECVEEYHQRRAMGERVAPEEWEERLGEHFEEFRAIIVRASSFDDLMNPVERKEKLPRQWGRYTLLDVLGRGGMGSVYRASDETLGRVVALKILRHGYENDPVAVERFRREARACAQIHHDHVITILDSGVNDGQPYYAMPIVEGESLQMLIREERVPDLRELCEGLAGVADALAELHGKGIVHRDVKPGNILVDETGRMLLSDFGLARTAASETLTQTGQAIGTPLYMSPEQVSSQSEVDGRSDVYGLGVTLYEALSGRPPFEPTDMAALINLKLTVPAPDLRKYAPDVPADLARIAMTAVEKEKADRYESAEAMASDLRAWIGGRKVAGRPVSSARRRWRRSRRNILLAASMVLAAIGIWQLIPPADGAVTVTANVQAQVTVDGVSEGTTEVHVVRSPGSYVFALTRSGCDAVRFEHLVRSGAEDRHHVQMQVKDGDSENNLDDFGESLGITFEDGPLQRPRSGGSGLGLQILYPRGSVRVSDLTEVMLEFNDPLVETSGEIQLRRLGSEVPLWTGTLSDDDEAGFIQPIEFPPSLRAAVWPGDELTLGYYLPGWETTVHIVVTGDPCAESFPRVDGELAKQPELFRDHMKAQLLFDEALYTAAYFMARSITDRVPKSSRGWYLQKKCLERMGVLSGLRSEDLLDAFDGTDPEKQKLVDPTTGN